MNRIRRIVLAGAFLLCPATQMRSADADDMADRGNTADAGSRSDQVEPRAEEGWAIDAWKSLKLSGFIETSYTFNANKAHPSAVQENVGRVFDTDNNEFMLNSAEINIERPVGQDKIVGFKLTPFFGQDAKKTQALGLFRGNDGASRTDFDLVNAFIQVEIPKTRTRIVAGKCETTAGAEVIHAPLNDNFSRSYLFGYAIPFTHMGIMAYQPLLKRPQTDADMLTLFAGVSNGWDNVKDLNESKMIHFGGTFTPSDEFSFTGNYFYSFSEQPVVSALPASNAHPRQLVDLVATIRPSSVLKDLKLLLNFDWGGEEQAPSVSTRSYAQWWGFSGIVRQDFALLGTKKNWYIAARGEYFDDVNGARTIGLAGFPVSPALRVWETTLTLGFKPWENLLLRSELRYDRANEKVFFRRSESTKYHQVTLALEGVVLF